MTFREQLLLIACTFLIAFAGAGLYGVHPHL